MAIAALIVAIAAALATGVSALYARRLDGRAAAAVTAAEKSAKAAERSAVASESGAALEADRRRAELTPRFRITADAVRPLVGNPGEDLTMTVFLAGPPELGRLDSLTVRIRDDYPERAQGSQIAGGPSREQVAAQIWGPYKFLPGSGPDGQLPDGTGRFTVTRGMAVGEPLVFILTPTIAPPRSSATFWERKMLGHCGTASAGVLP